MIVYVESNFILELVRLQDESEACSEILHLAEESRLRLVLPAFSVAEPFDVVRRSSSERRQLQTQVEKQLRLLGRSTNYEGQLAQAAEVTALLIESGRVEVERLHEVLASVIEVAEVIPVTSGTLRKALEAQREHGLSLQDAVVFMSVLEHARSAGTEQKCFLERDAKDFVTPDIEHALDQHDCRIISSFVGGIGFIKAQLEHR